MSGFGALWRIRTCKHIRTMRSTRVNTGPGRHAGWPRLQDTERIAEEKKRLQVCRPLPKRTAAC